MMPHRVDHGSVTSEIKFVLGINPFGGITFAGTQNWFDLLRSANIYSVRRKSQPRSSRKNRSSPSGRLTRARTVDDEVSVSAKKDRPKSMILERNNNLIEQSKPSHPRSKITEDKKLSETGKSVDKKTSKQSNVLPSRRSPVPKKPEIPVINIIKASNESIPGLFLSESSDEDSDYEDGDCVYECCGFAASAEDMTIENPLFQEKQFESSYRTPELPKQYWKDVFVESV